MVSEWMPNGNIAEYIKWNDCQRMKLVRKSFSGWQIEADELCSSLTVRRGCDIFMA